MRDPPADGEVITQIQSVLRISEPRQHPRRPILAHVGVDFTPTGCGEERIASLAEATPAASHGVPPSSIAMCPSWWYHQPRKAVI